MSALPELLFLCHRVPYPPDKGEKIRAWHVLLHLARSYRIHLGCLTDAPVDVGDTQELRQICASVGCFNIQTGVQKLRALAGLRAGRPLTVDFFHNRDLMRWVTESLVRHPIDRVYVFSSGMAGYVRHLRGCIRVLDMVDIDSEKWRAYAPHHPWPMRVVYRREADTLLALERQLVFDFDTTLFVSEAEADRFAVISPECRERIGWVENGVDLERFSPAQSFARPYPEGIASIVFTGTMNYWPNVEAVNWFVDHVLPIVRRNCPRAHFYIIGDKPSRAVLRLRRNPDVTVSGRVPDIRPFIAHADVAVAPLRIARGIQNKVLEAMALGRPVVATLEAFEGVRAAPGHDLLVASGPTDMAQSILAVLEGQHPGLGMRARLAIERNHCWTRTLQRLDELFPRSTHSKSARKQSQRTMLSPTTAI
jgi:sugar transferase (PEP-CTERM/EpsH1 system associated)